MIDFSIKKFIHSPILDLCNQITISNVIKFAPLILTTAISGLELYRATNPIRLKHASPIDTSDYDEFIRTIGSREDLLITIGDRTGCAGTNISYLGSPTIYMEDGLNNKAFGFYLKHELAHLINNDCLTMYLVKAIVMISSQVLILKYRKNYGLTKKFLVYAIAKAVSGRYFCWRESAADDFAIRHSSIEEMENGVKGLEGFQLMGRCFRVFHPLLYYTYSPKGDYRFELFYPSLSSRIAKINAAIEFRKL